VPGASVTDPEAQIWGLGY